MILGFKLRKKCIDFIEVFRRLTNILGYLVWLTVDPMKFNQIKTKKIKNLLICEVGGGLGDIINTIGLVNSFKNINKEVNVFLAIKEEYLNLAKGNPKIKFSSSKISEIIKKFKIDAAIIIIGKQSIFIDKIRILTTLQNDSFKSNLTLSNFFVTRRKFPRVGHKIKRRIHCFELLGFKIPNKLEFYSDKKDKLNVKKFYDKINPKKKKIILFNPDSGTAERARKLGLFPSHDWPTENYSKLADKFTQEHLILITGIEKSEIYAQEIVSNCKNKKNIKSICGKLSVREFGEFMKLCDLLVSVDTGTVHIATQVGIPVINLMGPYPKELYYAWPASSKAITLFHSEVCSGCRKYYCAEKNNICMKSITVEEVFNHSKFLLEKIKKSFLWRNYRTKTLFRENCIL